jgi:hypothetical protein
VWEGKTTVSTHSLNVDQRAVLVVYELSSKLGSLVGIQAGDVLEEGGVVGGVVDSLGVDDDFGELSSLGEACTGAVTPSVPQQRGRGGRDSHDLVGDVGSKVDGESKSHVVSSHDISELLAAFDLLAVVDELLRSKRCTATHLVLLQPLLEQLLAALDEHGTSELETLVLVETPALEEDTKVLEDGTELSCGDGDALELLDRLRGTEDASGGVGGDLGGLGVLLGGEELGELARVEVVGTGEVGARGETDREVGVVERAEDVGDDGFVVDGNGEDLPLAVHTDDTARALVHTGDEHRLPTDAVHVDARARLEVVEVDEPVLGDEVDDAVACRDLHRDGEVVRRLGGEEDVDGLLGVDGKSSLVVNFDDVEL